MSKYECDMIEGNKNDSRAVLSDMIKEYSTVLEMGPADGVMTRYLAGRKHCDVYIVEVDEECFHSASQYAKGGVCDNLNNDSWIEAFRDLKFDYIVFADVLEHLQVPEKALNLSCTLLKKQGKVLISVPNLCYEGVLAELALNCFDYNKVGILDNTHIHFFSYKSIRELMKKCNLKVISENTIDIGVQYSEFADFQLEYEEMYTSQIKRPFSKAYQFIFETCIGEDEYDLSFLKAKNSSELYWSIDGHFSATNRIISKINYGFNEVVYDKDFEAGYYRFDPIDDISCLVYNIEIIADGEKIDCKNIKCENGYISNGFFVFMTNDPQFTFLIQKNISKLEIKYWISPYNSNNKLLFEMYSDIMNSVKMNLTDKNDYLQNRCKKYEDMATCEMVKSNRLECKNRELIDANIRLEQHINGLHTQIDQIKNSSSWKITKPIRKIKNLIRKIFSSNKLFRHIWRALGLWKHHGFSVMRQECKQYRIRRKNGTDAVCATSGSIVAYSNNKDGYVPYDSEYQDNMDFSQHETMVKMLAFYLPQYHTFKENDEWWGEGFTEWVNVRKGEPRFDGHYQPRVPHKDIGYYSLEDIDTLKQQARLAKQHGIYGFCFYYYWFSGKRLMEKPVDMLLEHPEIDLPFCLCWANENWTRTWDGQAKNVLIGQEYSYEDDELFIKDIKKYVDDSRYIRIDGKPVIIVYNPGEIPDCEHTFKQWRRYAKEYGIGDILLWTCQTANHTAAELNIEDYIDAEVEFPPHNTWKEQFGVRDVDLHGGSAFIYNYDKVVDYQIEKMEKESDTKVPIYRCCTMGWDNSARRKQNWFAYYGYSLKSLYKWVTSIVKTSKQRFEDKECFAFINAWNEWGEGTYLDPDCRYGYANINTVSKALFELPLEDRFVVFNDSDEVKQCENLKTSDAKIAVQIHMFYLDTMEEIVDNLNKIPYTFDCYISTDTEEKKKTISTYFDSICKYNHCQVDIIQNRGRDVAPFLKQMKKVYSQYEYICHIHSKKTRTNDHGNEWRTYIFDHLFGNEKYLSHIFAMFEENPKLGIVMPETYPVLEYQAEWGGNREGVAALLHKMGIDIELPELPVFPVGDMFWMRSAAVKPIFDLDLSQADFPEEAGQVNETIAHQIERVWVYLAKSQGYDYVKVFNNCSEHLDMPKKKRMGIYVHYDKDNIISADDEKTVAYFSEFFDEFHFVTNSKLAEEELGKIRGYVQSVTCRENIGLDFGGWRQKLLQLGREYVTSFDEVVLLNNSFYKPVYDIKKMFNDMSNRKVDFWGVTIFPYSPDGSYIQKPYIPEHLQSYFMVFHDSVIQSDVFWDFWEAMPEYESFIDVVANCESQFTRILADAGFRYEPYIKETYYISKFLNNYRIPYEKPVSLVLLKDPFIKKKCIQYMDEMERIKLIRLTEELQA